MKVNRHIVRESIYLFQVALFCILYIPHIIVYFLVNKKMIDMDLDRLKNKTYLHMPRFVLLLFELHHDEYFRTLFYHRIGPVLKMIIGWYRPGASTFIIPPSLKVGGGIYAPHAYATILNAKVIGNNFTCIQCTTIGKKNDERPTIGNNVSLGANVVIIGNVTIGDNSTIGAGSVVTKDIPPNSVAVGVPAKVIKRKS